MRAVRPDSASPSGDIVVWSEHQTALLRRLSITGLDAEHMAEEIDSLGRNKRSELGSRLAIVMMHLLKWEFQSERRSRSWVGTLETQRAAIELLLDRVPSLRGTVENEVLSEYRRAVTLASVDTGMPKSAFPATCPYKVAELLDPDFPADIATFRPR